MERGLIKIGNDILSQENLVPSALTGLTSLFGMERGEPRCNSHHKTLMLNDIHRKKSKIKFIAKLESSRVISIARL